MKNKKQYYRSLHQEIWEDEKVKEKGITQDEVKIVLDAFGRHISDTLRDTGIFRWKNIMKLEAKKIEGFETFNVVEGKAKMIDDYYRIQFKPSENLKSNVKKRKEDLEKLNK